MRTNYFFFCLIFCVSTTAYAQTTNFDETWREFLENDKISNMSALVKPDPVYKLPEYAKYLLMNTNTDFCQSRVAKAEGLMAEVQAIDPAVHKSIPGFVGKMEGLAAKMDAYHRMDDIWNRFRSTRTVSLEELNDIEAAQTSCEKQTLAKYSFMTAHYHLCAGDIVRARNIFENRTLRLTEKTSLRVADVPGLAEEVNRLKTLFADISEVDAAWQTYVQTGVSPGFQRDIPLFPCYPTPNMKVLILRGATDDCSAAPAALEALAELQAQTGVTPDGEIARKIKDLEAAVAEDAADLAALNEAWEAFIPDNKVKHMGRYGYEYCDKEALIRAYVMDGFAYLCELAEPMLEKIDSIQQAEMLPLADITMIKINELAALSEEYQANGREIERLWRNFVAQNDRLLNDYQSADFYCDNIHQVKDWTMQGLTGTCEEGLAYLQEIEDFQRTFEFSFTADVECRVQNLRVKVWTCRRDALLKLAEIEAPDAPEQRLAELMAEYGVGEQPEACAGDL